MTKFDDLISISLPVQATLCSRFGEYAVPRVTEATIPQFLARIVCNAEVHSTSSAVGVDEQSQREKQRQPLEAVRIQRGQSRPVARVAQVVTLIEMSNELDRLAHSAELRRE